MSVVDLAVAPASTFRDFLFEDLAKMKNEFKMADGKRKGPRGGVTDSFPAKLYEMLHEALSDGMDRIISWQVHGRCFKIHDLDVFVRELLPNYFRQTKFSSFKRQMNLYGFRKVLSGTDCGSYYHELFVRGRPDLAMILRRVGGKSSSYNTWRPFQGEDDPDFYALPFCPELARSVAVVSGVSDQSLLHETNFSRQSSLQASVRPAQSSWEGCYTEPPLLAFLREQRKVPVPPFSGFTISVPTNLTFPRQFECYGPSNHTPFAPTLLTAQAQGPLSFPENCFHFPRKAIAQEKGPVSFEEIFNEPLTANNVDDFDQSAVELLWAFEGNRFP